MVGRTPNNAEKAMITLIKYLGYKQGKIKKTGIRWNKRSLKRAELGTGDFYNNCVWGTFKNPYGKPRMFEMDVAFPDSKLNIEIDGIWYHSNANEDKDIIRDEILKYNGWSIIRIPTYIVYKIFVPLLNDFIKKN